MAKATRHPQHKYLMKLAIIADIIVLLCAFDAWFREPNMLTITRISDVSSKIAPQTGKLKIVHISDIHYECDTPAIIKLISAVHEEKPDIIVLTGDVPQFKCYDADNLNRLLGRLNAVAPVYSVCGSESPDVLLDSPIREGVLVSGNCRRVNIRGTKVVLQGFRTSEKPAGRPDVGNSLYLELDHIPDHIPLGAKLHPDWYFCGHTHGGQVRLPIWGAVTTNSSLGKKYEYGRYKVGDMNVFVTRGIGMRPRPSPPIRFLCPPEMMVLTISRKNP